MSAPVLATKLYIPAPQPGVVPRPRLIGQLNAGLHRKLTLISAGAGFGKTTLAREWVAGCGLPVAWLSLDAGDSDPMRFLTYMVSALQTVAPGVGSGVLGAMQSPQPPPVEAIMTSLLNEVSTIPGRLVLVLDDVHVVESWQVDTALNFLVDHLPPSLHLVITTREDPHLPLARLRSRGQLAELRAGDLRFTLPEAATFLNETMGLQVGLDDIIALETRTEGWIAGLQLAAISMQGHADTSSFIATFTGSHRFVLDYLMEEVLHQQPEHIQTFLLQTSILDRMSGPLCDAVLSPSPASGQETLEYLERANLFTVPLDNERRWYRYHHLFAGLLRQRLAQRTGEDDVCQLHIRASAWLEAQGLEMEAFRHAAAGQDVERVERIIDGSGVPLFARGGALPVLEWLASLPEDVLDARPWLWITFATTHSIIGQMSLVEPKLRRAEAALEHVESSEQRHIFGVWIAELRELIGILFGDPQHMQTIIDEYPDPSADAISAANLWKLGLAHLYTGNRDIARRVFESAIAACEATGNVHVNILATSSMASVHERANRLQVAFDTCQRAIRMIGEPPGPIACEAFGGLARISREWNDIAAAEAYGRQSAELAAQLEIPSFISSEVFLARLQLDRGDADGAIAALADVEQEALRRGFPFRLPEIAGTQVIALIALGNLDAAGDLVNRYDIPIARARVEIARGDCSAALATLSECRERFDVPGWEDERLKAVMLMALAHHVQGNTAEALTALDEALALAEPGGFIRLFVDEGAPMMELLVEAAARGMRPAYVNRLLAASRAGESPRQARPSQPLVDPLSERELEVLQLLAQGLSNQQIGDRLYLALSTVKGHNRNIFAKLQVARRTEAIARARDLGIL